jgi:hypothetical protein
MGKYRVTSPDGKTFEVNAPDGATEADVLQYAQSQFSAKPESPKPQTRDEAYKAFKEKGWGTGLPKAAYDLGGKVTDATGSPAAGYAANVVTQALPALFSGSKMPDKPVMSLGQKPAEMLMASATKPTVEQWRTGKAAKAIQTMLDEGVGPTSGGVEKLKSRIADLNDEISASISNSTATVDKKVVASYLQDAVNKFEKQVTPGADVKAIQAAWDEFLAHPILGDKIPVQTAQELKKGTYKVLGEKAYGEQKGAAAEAQKTLARGLKEEISKAVPAVGPANAKEGELINALKVAERRTLMDANKNPLGLGALISQPWMLPIWMWDRSPGGKAAVANMLYQGGRPENIAPLGVLSGEAVNQPQGILYRK